MIIEICCGSAEDAIRAYEAGANRVELCSSLFLGGLTPSIGSLKTVKRHAPIEIMAMVRPREGGFCYNDYDFQVCLEDAAALLEAGADGLVFGFLTESGEVDIERTRKLVEIAGPKPCTFHRAIDVVPDYRRAIDQLVELGLTRILTSGQEASVYEGAETVADMIRYADGRIKIMPGAGITLKNIDKIASMTACEEMHLAFYENLYDHSVANNRSIFYGGALYPPEEIYQRVNRDAVRSARTQI
ncbi:MAG: copper homeostasis protein CutC [Eubacteriales bacterium]|nr:copper homeostasis protein CutC [Eubacteriales bacterium]